MKFSDRHSLNKQRWYKTPEFLFHAPFAGVTALLLSFGALNHSTGLIQAGVFLLVCTLFSLALMLYALRMVHPVDKKVAKCRPNAQFYHLMTVHKDSILVLLPNSSAKSLPGVLIALDWGLELWDYKRDVILSSMKWKEILGAEATSSFRGSTIIDILILWLTDDRVIKFQTVSATHAYYDIIQYKDKYYESLSDEDLLEEYKQIYSKVTKGVKEDELLESWMDIIEGILNLRNVKIPEDFHM